MTLVQWDFLLLCLFGTCPKLLNWMSNEGKPFGQWPFPGSLPLSGTKFFEKVKRSSSLRSENLPGASLLILVSDQSKRLQTLDIEGVQQRMLSDQRVATELEIESQRYPSKSQKQLFYYCTPGGAVGLITAKDLKEAPSVVNSTAPPFSVYRRASLEHGNGHNDFVRWLCFPWMFSLYWSKSIHILVCSY